MSEDPVLYVIISNYRLHIVQSVTYSLLGLGDPGYQPGYSIHTQCLTSGDIRTYVRNPASGKEEEQEQQERTSKQQWQEHQEQDLVTSMQDKMNI